MQTQIKVRGYHLDVYQHVNNARYLEFLEEARWDITSGLSASSLLSLPHPASSIIDSAMMTTVAKVNIFFIITS